MSEAQKFERPVGRPRKDAEPEKVEKIEPKVGPKIEIPETPKAEPKPIAEPKNGYKKCKYVGPPQYQYVVSGPDNKIYVFSEPHYLCDVESGFAEVLDNGVWPVKIA